VRPRDGSARGEGRGGDVQCRLDEQNHRLSELGAIIQQLVPRAEVITNDLITDKRNYYVRFDKIKRTLGFMPEHTLAESVLEMKEALEDGTVVN